MIRVAQSSEGIGCTDLWNLYLSESYFATVGPLDKSIYSINVIDRAHSQCSRKLTYILNKVVGPQKWPDNSVMANFDKESKKELKRIGNTFYYTLWISLLHTMEIQRHSRWITTEMTRWFSHGQLQQGIETNWQHICYTTIPCESHYCIQQEYKGHFYLTPSLNTQPAQLILWFLHYQSMITYSPQTKAKSSSI